MNLIIIIFAFTLAFSCGGALREKRHFRSVNASSSVPKVNLKSAQRDDCEVNNNTIDEASNAVDVLHLFGDGDIVLSDASDQQKEHCEDAKKHLEIFEKHAKCVKDKRQSQFVIPYVKRLRRLVTKECTSEKWHEEYIKFSQCLKDKTIKQAFHQCSYKLALLYKTNYFETPANQLPFSMCCFQPMVSKCMIDAIEPCGQEVTDFIVGRVWEAGVAMMTALCEGKYEERCDDELNEKFINIFAQKEVAPHNGGYKYFLLSLVHHPRDDIVILDPSD